MNERATKMNRKIVLMLLRASLLACNFLFPQTSSQEAPDPPPTEPALQPSDPQDLAPIGFSIVRLRPGDGDLQTMLADEAQKALALGQIPVVEFDATWCPPCQAIDAAIKSRDELMLNAYSGTYIIKLDVDEWGWGDSSLHDFQL